ncbi:hypothetical protein HGRIS_011853 [Hohenbuehelia grisea]|uniref:WD40 repeat-like protein n=1 Tax=Hohenbuehelia grisea TaxID=104357 RepID=A0ABR3JX85_9AGAR
MQKFQKAVTLNKSALINALLFTKDGSLLLTGRGDEGTVKVWDLSSSACLETISYPTPHWEQITGLIWAIANNGDHSRFLCIGTGRGKIGFAKNRSVTPFLLGRISVTHAFDHPVEAMATDHINFRFAAASQSGIIKVFQISGPSSSDVLYEILAFGFPRGLHFSGDEHKELVCYCLSQNRVAAWRVYGPHIKRLWVRSLNGPLGSVSVSDNGQSILIQDLKTSEFDIYSAQATMQLARFTTGSTESRIIQGAFIHSQAVVLGSDHGEAYVYNTSTRNAACLQKLTHDTGEEYPLVQLTAICRSSGKVLMATGANASSAKKSEICVWTQNTISEPDLVDSASGKIIHVHQHQYPKLALIFTVMVFGVFQLLVIMIMPSYLLRVWGDIKG